MSFPTQWFKRHSSLLLLGVFLLVQNVCWRHLPGVASQWIRKDAKLLNLQPTQLQGVTWNSASRTLQTKEKRGYVTWPMESGEGVLHVQVRMVSTDSLPVLLLLQYITTDMPYYDDDVVHSKTIRPVTEHDVKTTTMTWHLPRVAESVRLQLPPACQLQLTHIQFTGHSTTESSWHNWRQALGVLCLAVSFSLFIHWLSQYVNWLNAWYRSPAAISITWLAVQGLVMIWLLPPFQGPDENRHWKTAVELYRGQDGQADSVLYRLPALLHAESPRLRSEIPYQPRSSLEGDDAQYWIESVKVTYTRHWGYPTVGLVSILFPPVRTVNEALLFFYTCRLVNLACLLCLVAYAWKWNVGSWTLVMFLSLPLVLQQCVIISTDTMHNLGTFLAMLLFTQQLKHRSIKLWCFLFLVSCLVVAAKPPIYLLILLLPVWFSPWHLLRRPLFWIPAVIIIVLLLSIGTWYLWHIVDGTGMQLGKEAREQLQYVMTAPGLAQFCQASMEYPRRFLDPVYWFGPLGWLDTNLSDLHSNLIWISFWLAVGVDVGLLLYRTYRRGTASMLAMLPALVGSLLFGLMIWWSLALVMYLTISGYQSAGIVGMQVRYMVPFILMLLMWPAACLHEQKNPAQQFWLVQWLGCVMGIVALIRAITLAMDLLIRYSP